MPTIGPIKWRGLVNQDTYFDLAPGACSTLTDLDVFRSKLQPRRGSFPVATLAGSGRGIFYWEDPANYPSNTSAAIVIVQANLKYYTGPFGQDSTAISFADKTGSASPSNSDMTSDCLNSIFVMCDGTAPQKLASFSASVASLGGSPPNAQVVEVINNFMFLTGNSTNVSRVYWSNVGDPETWGASNYLDFRKNDGDMCVGLEGIGTDLYIFKRRSIGRLSTGTLTVSGSVTLGPLSTVIEGVGGAGPRATDNLPDGSIVFLGSDFHLYRFDGVFLKDLSKQPYPGPDISFNLVFSEGVAGSNTDTPIVQYYPPKHQVLVVGTRVSQSVYAYNLEGNDWSQYTNTTMNGLCIAGPSRPNFTSAATNPSWRIMHLGAANKVYSFDDGNQFSPEADNGSQAFQGVAITSAVPDVDQYGFIPRSLILPIFVQENGSYTVKVTFGFDGTLNASPSLNLTANMTSQYRKLVVPIPQATAKWGSGIPWSLQIKVEFSAGGQATGPAYVLPFYLSSELAPGSYTN